MRWLLVTGYCFLLFTTGCSFRMGSSSSSHSELNVRLVDTLASYHTVLLFANLKHSAGTSILFGHHDSPLYGIGWKGSDDRSDVQSVTGSHAALFGFDFAGIAGHPTQVFKPGIREIVKIARKKNIVITFCWHNNNPVTNGSFYDTTRAVHEIISGGRYHQKYLEQLDRIAVWADLLRDDEGELIPVIFRPYHEWDGSWFWWGSRHCTVEEFIQLWRETVTYLRDTKQVRNFLYAFSPDCRFNSEREFLERYPGDDFVDVLGMDNYWDFGDKGGGFPAVRKKLKIISALAEKRGKLAALTETGQDKLPDSLWFTNSLYPQITADSVKLSWVMVWRNAGEHHFYVPYPGHPAVRNLIDFKEKPDILFQDELLPVYDKHLPAIRKENVTNDKQ